MIFSITFNIECGVYSITDENATIGLAGWSIRVIPVPRILVPITITVLYLGYIYIYRSGYVEAVQRNSNVYHHFVS